MADDPKLNEPQINFPRPNEFYAEYVKRYGEKHPQMAKAMTDLQEAQRQFELEVGRAVQSIRNDYETAVLEEQSFSQALNAAKSDAQDLSNKSVDYNVMEREAKSNHAVYDTLLQQEKELRVSSNSRANNVRSSGSLAG